MKTWIYSWLAYPLILGIVQIFGLFRPKIRKTLQLRSWKHFLSLRFNASTPIEYWIHAASVGELEYAIPIIEELQKRNKKVLVTYFSISAKTAIEKLPNQYSNVSLVVPLPHDGLGLMKEFVRLVRNQGVSKLLLMKYELWPGLLWECGANGVRVILVDALKPGWFNKRLLHKLHAMIAGYEQELKDVAHPRLVVLGDTRVERVRARAQRHNEFNKSTLSLHILQRIKEGKTLVCGSMWPQDDVLLEKVLLFLNERNINIIWVPHELESKQSLNVKKLFERAAFHTAIISECFKTEDSKLYKNGPLAVIVMKKGVLVELYKLGKFAYVGGGFGDGVHSVWEPSLMGAQVFCGPRRHRSPESYELERAGLLNVVSSGRQFESLLQFAIESCGDDSDVIHSRKMESVLARHLNAAGRIINYIEGNYESRQGSQISSQVENG